MSNVPRLSGALRVYTGLTRETDQNDNSAELLRKRQFITKKRTSVEGTAII